MKGVLISGVHQLAVKLLYGSGLRIIDCLRLRIQDIDFADRQGMEMIRIFL